jgi:hypothetical protein
MVMIDPETEKNMIIWDKSTDEQVNQYQVWKVAGTDWTLIKELNESDTSTMIDMSSKPKSKTDAYCLVTIDSCGNASQKSPWHKPFLLQSNLGTNNVINLSWESYLVSGEEYIFKSIIIYRGTDSTLLTPIDTIAAGIGSNKYTDENPPQNVNVYYRIGGEKEVPCDPNNINGKKASAGPYLHSLSNLEDNRLQGVPDGIKVNSANNVKIYPNPLNTETKITWNNPDGANFDLIIYDLKGKQIRTIPGLSGKEYIIQRENMQNGCYILELKGRKTSHVRLMVN